MAVGVRCEALVGLQCRFHRSPNRLSNRLKRCVALHAVTSTREVSTVMKFGGTSVRDAERMAHVADIVEGVVSAGEWPCVVLSAMGSTTNLLQQMGEKAERGKIEKDNLRILMGELRNLHLETCTTLHCDEGTVEDVSSLLDEVEQLLAGVSILRELTPRASDYLSSFGERMSTRIFASYMRARNVVDAKQYDSFDIGFVSTDDFTNGDILVETYTKLDNALGGPTSSLPIVTGFLARGKHSNAITTLGRGGSDLSATVIGKSLGLSEVQVWKDVDGVLTTDPRLVPAAKTVPNLTFEEATELAYFGATVLHPQSMQPAMESDNISVRVKNSYDPTSSGTIITHRPESKRDDLITSIVLKRNVTMLEIVSTRMLGQYGFLQKVFQVFSDNEISVDLVTTSEVSVCVTLDPAKIWSRQLQQQELDKLVSCLKEFSKVKLNRHLSIVSLIGDMKRSSNILQDAFAALGEKDIHVQLISKGEKPNIALVVKEDDAVVSLKCLHEKFFE